jgi:hypothetical protein
MNEVEQVEQQRELDRKLEDAIEQTLNQKRSAGVFDAAGCACTVIEGLALENPEEWALLRDQVAADAITARIQRRLQRLVNKTDVRQGILALPGFQRVPQLIKVDGGIADIREVTLEQYRESEEELRARIKSYSYARRSSDKLKRDKEQLAHMTKLDRRVAPLMGDVKEKMGVGMDAYAERQATPVGKRSRAAAEKRWKKSRRA